MNSRRARDDAQHECVTHADEGEADGADGADQQAGDQLRADVHGQGRVDVLKELAAAPAPTPLRERLQRDRPKAGRILQEKEGENRYQHEPREKPEQLDEDVAESFRHIRPRDFDRARRTLVDGIADGGWEPVRFIGGGPPERPRARKIEVARRLLCELGDLSANLGEQEGGRERKRPDDEEIHDANGQRAGHDVHTPSHGERTARKLHQWRQQIGEEDRQHDE